MKIRCDICSVTNKQLPSSENNNAEYIHLSKTHKISLLCQKCLSQTDNEIFYLPIDQYHSLSQNDETEMENESLQGKNRKSRTKYTKRMSQNKDSPFNEQAKRKIKQMFQKQIWQPFRELQQSMMAYRSILGQYKKTVRAQYKAIMSKMDPSIIESFKQIVIEMHQQSGGFQRQIGGVNRQSHSSSRTSVQKQELDIFIRGMKISALNEWNKVQVLIDAARRSYEKFKHVFMNEKDELNKKTTLLKKIISKITIQYQYKKTFNKQLGKSKNKVNKQGCKQGEAMSFDQIVDIDESDEVMVISQDQGNQQNQQKPNNQQQSIISDGIQLISQFNTCEDKLTKNNCHCIQLQQDSDTIQFSNLSQQTITINNASISKQLPQIKNNQSKVQIRNTPVPIHQQHQFSAQKSPLNQINNSYQPIYNLAQQNHALQTITKQPQIQRNSTQSYEASQSLDIHQSINIDQDCYLDQIPSKTIQSTTSTNSNHSSQRPSKTASINSFKTLDLQTKKTSSPTQPINTFHQYEIFQISVDNYINPLQSLKSFLTTDFKIKKELEKHHIILPPLNKPSSVHDYSPYLKLIRKLKISYTRKKLLAQLLKFISQCTQLQSLTICQPFLATEDIIQFIITSIPKLKSLQFLCSNKLNQEHFKLIPSHLPQLEELYYGPKTHNNIALKSEYRQFRQHKKQKRLSSVKNTTLIELMEKLSSLRNVWISEINNMETIFQYLQTKENLEHLIVGKYVTDSSTMELSAQCWNSIKKLTNLHSLALLNIRIDTNSLDFVLKNNFQTLKSLEIYACANWTDELASLLKKCRSLKEFYLFNSDESIFTGHSLWDATTLQTIVLRSCQFMDFKAAQQKIGRLSQLKHIDVYGCEWFNDTILSELVKNKYITYLNLANTQIGSLFHESLRLLFKIRCLALGSTRINAAAIEELCAQFPGIQKLSLYNLCGSAVFNGRCMVKKNRLNKIGDILKGLNYIDIGSLNTADDTIFDHFKSIKTIYLWMSTNLSQKKIQEVYLKGVNVVDDV